jgi:hypothetical protein
MSFQDLSLKKLAIILVAAGVIIVFAVSGFQARNVFASSVTENVQIVIKTDTGICIVEGSDMVPRNISDCSYSMRDTISITYKPQQPNIGKHELRQAAAK